MRIPRPRGTWLLWSTTAQVLTAVAGLLTNIIYARNLSLTEVGEVAVANSVATLVTVALDRGLGSWITANLRMQGWTERQAVRLALRGAAPGLAVYILATLVVYAASRHTRVGQVCLITLPLTLGVWLFQLALSLQQGADRPRARALTIGANGVVTFAGTLVVLHLTATPAAAIVISAVAYGAVAAVPLVVAMLAPRRDGEVVGGPWSPTAQRRALTESRALFGANIGTFAASSGDVLLATALLPGPAVGQYQIAKKVAQAGVLPFSTALPMLLGRIARLHPERKRTIVVEFARAYTVLFGLGAAVGVVVLPTAMSKVFGPEFRSTADIVLILGLAFSLQLLRDALGTYRTSVGDYRGLLTANFVTVGALCAGSAVIAPFSTLTLFSVVIAMSYGAGIVSHIATLRRDAEWRSHDTLRFVGLSLAMATVAAAGAGIVRA